MLGFPRSRRIAGSMSWVCEPEDAPEDNTGRVIFSAHNLKIFCIYILSFSHAWHRIFS